MNKILELAKNNSKISDFHLRGGSDIACRIMGDIVIQKNSKIENKDIDEILKILFKELEINRDDLTDISFLFKLDMILLHIFY